VKTGNGGGHCNERLWMPADLVQGGLKEGQLSAVGNEEEKGVSLDKKRQGHSNG